MTAASFWGQSARGSPPEHHPGQSAGAVIRNFPRFRTRLVLESLISLEELLPAMKNSPLSWKRLVRVQRGFVVPP